eukprot:5771672-Prymnesium_polylepis.2
MNALRYALAESLDDAKPPEYVEELPLRGAYRDSRMTLGDVDVRAFARTHAPRPSAVRLSWHAPAPPTRPPTSNYPHRAPCRPPAVCRRRTARPKASG